MISSVWLGCERADLGEVAHYGHTRVDYKKSGPTRHRENPLLSIGTHLNFEFFCASLILVISSFAATLNGVQLLTGSLFVT